MSISDKRRAELVAGPYTRLLAEHEEAMAALYDSFANALTSAESFWRSMSREEMIHKNLILEIDQKLQSGEWKFKRPKFVTSGIIDSLEWIAAQRHLLETKGISMREALEKAIDLESSMIESSFFDVLDGDNAEMIEAVETQTAYTRAHIRRLKKEAKRLKWRIFGNRKLFPNSVAKTLTREELKTNIKASQATMLGMLIAMEEATCKLYKTYDERLAEPADFWAKIAAEEMQHASMLRQLYKILESGKLFYNVENFNKKALAEIIEFIQDSEFDAQHNKLSHNEALSVAMKVERSMLERGFYSVVTSDAPEYQIIAKRLMELTLAHTAKMEAETHRCTNLFESFLRK